LIAFVFGTFATAGAVNVGGSTPPPSKFTVPVGVTNTVFAFAGFGKPVQSVLQTKNSGVTAPSEAVAVASPLRLNDTVTG
jgi:hypothetical protein